MPLLIKSLYKVVLFSWKMPALENHLNALILLPPFVLSLPCILSHHIVEPSQDNAMQTVCNIFTLLIVSPSVLGSCASLWGHLYLPEEIL